MCHKMLAGYSRLTSIWIFSICLRISGMKEPREGGRAGWHRELGFYHILGQIMQYYHSPNSTKYEKLFYGKMAEDLNTIVINSMNWNMLLGRWYQECMYAADLSSVTFVTASMTPHIVSCIDKLHLYSLTLLCVTTSQFLYGYSSTTHFLLQCRPQSYASYKSGDQH